MLVSHGRGGLERQDHVKLGSVVEHALLHSPCPVFMVSARPRAGAVAPQLRA
jgi:nucleotide-binding universal stress UspA family protein